jgi:hypothetical protein
VLRLATKLASAAAKKPASGRKPSNSSLPTHCGSMQNRTGDWSTIALQAGGASGGHGQAQSLMTMVLGSTQAGMWMLICVRSVAVRFRTMYSASRSVPFSTP